MQHERRAGKLWLMLANGSADAAYQAMARFAAEPAAGVKMARLRLKPAETTENESVSELESRRGVELLEALGTTTAWELLVELSHGEPTSHCTIAAWQALERLQRTMYNDIGNQKRRRNDREPTRDSR
jgi:hypothetical protein